jgi:hypothetical protein
MMSLIELSIFLTFKLDSRSICFSFPLRGLSARAVSDELPDVLRADATASSTITKYLRQRQFTSILVTPLPEEPATIVIDQTILDALEQYPFSYIRELARLTCIPTTTVHRHLTPSLGFVMKHLRWVPTPSRPLKKWGVLLSQLSFYARFGRSNTTVGRSLSLLTRRGSDFLQIKSRSGFV